MKQAIGKQTLRNRLPGASDENLKALLSMLRQDITASSEPFTALLMEGCSPATLQSALIEYRDGLLEDGRLNAGGVRALIRQFDRLGFMLLQALAKACQTQVSDLESRLSVAGTELQMASARARWVREGEVTLYNYFHEVPVMARVAIHGVRESGFEVDRSADLVHVLAAGQHGRFAHIRLADLRSCLRLEVGNADRKRVHFRYAGIFKTAQEHRQHIRVQCGDALRLMLTDASGENIEAEVLNLSEAGFGLEVRQMNTVQIDDTLHFELWLSTGEAKGSCSVCWLHRANAQAGQTRFGVELNLTPALLRRLQAEVSQRKKRILGELRILGTPDSLV